MSNRRKFAHKKNLFSNKASIQMSLRFNYFYYAQHIIL